MTTRASLQRAHVSSEECDLCSSPFPLGSLESRSSRCLAQGLLSLEVCCSAECAAKATQLERALEGLLEAKEGLLRVIRTLALTRRKQAVIAGKLENVWDSLKSSEIKSSSTVSGVESGSAPVRMPSETCASQPSILRPKRARKRRGAPAADEDVDKIDRNLEREVITVNSQEDISQRDSEINACDKCKKKFKSREALDGHSKFHLKGVVNADGTFQCPHCPESFEELESLRQHEKKYHRLPRDFCPICKKQMSRNSLQQHLQSHYLKQSSFPLRAEDIHCVICGREFGSPLFLAFHMELHKGSCSCHVSSCRKGFGTFELRDIHMREFHHNSNTEALDPADPPKDCPYCNDFHRQHQHHPKILELKNHIEQHELEIQQKRYLCQTCGCSFVSKKSLETHFRLTHDKEAENKEFKCNSCDKVFSNLQKLKCHLQTHENEGSGEADKISPSFSFPCLEPNCGKRFSQKVSLQNHVMVHHSGDMRYKCTHCEDQGQSKGFTYPQGLRDHLFKEHKDVLGASRNQFLCSVCYKAFSTEQELLGHEGGHVKSKCRICGKQFKSVAHLKEHTLRHASVRPFRCVFCPKGYFRQQELNNHTKKAHAGGIINEPLPKTEVDLPRRQPSTLTDRITYIIQLPS